MAKGRSTVIHTLYLDSSVLFTAVNSPSGGSSKLFTIDSFRLITTPFVLTEVERNVRKKLFFHHLSRFFHLVSLMEIKQTKLSQSVLHKAEMVIHKKDAYILAEAKLLKPDILVSLDTKHFFTSQVERFIKPIHIFTPKMAMEKYSK